MVFVKVDMIVPDSQDEPIKLNFDQHPMLYSLQLTAAFAKQECL